MGKIFGKEEKAESVISEIEIELKRANQKVAKKPKVLFIEFMPNNIEAFGKELLSGDIVEKLGGEVVGVLVLIELAGLKGREKIAGYRLDAAITYEGK